MSNLSSRRIHKELKEWNQNPLDHIHTELIDDDIFKWKVTMTGPQGTPYYQGKYILHIVLSDNYPFHGISSIRFKTKIYCCNVSDNGEVSTDLFGENWNSKCTIKQSLQIIYKKCFHEAGDYDFNCVLNTGLNKLLYQNTQQFIQNALKWNYQFAQGIWNRFYTFPQVPQSEYIQRINFIASIIDNYSSLSIKLIHDHLIPFCYDEETECGLYEFLQKFQNKQKYQGDVWSSDHFVERTHYDFTINVQTLNGDIVPLKVNANDTVYYIKQILAMKLQTPLKQQLLYKSKQLDDGNTLKDYNLSAGCTLHLVIRCRGGCIQYI